MNWFFWRQPKKVIDAATKAAVGRMEEHAAAPLTWLEQRKQSRERNEEAEVRPYSDFAKTAVEGDQLAKETSRKLLADAGVTDDTFERAWVTNP